MTNDFPTVTLANGIRVGNFSSPHPFIFDDGTTLDACHADRARALMLEQRETEHAWRVNDVDITDIQLAFEMSPAVHEEIDRIQRDEDVDVVIVPLPVLQCLRDMVPDIQRTKFRGIRVADRVSKTVHSDRFCI